MKKQIFAGALLAASVAFAPLAHADIVIGLVANGVAVSIGLMIGILSGYMRGLIGSALMRFTDLMMAFPALLLAIVLAALLRPSLWIVAMVIALVNVRAGRRAPAASSPGKQRCPGGRNTRTSSSGWSARPAARA